MSDILSLLILSSIAQGVFFGVSLLISKFYRSKANQYFSFFIFLLVIETLLGVVDTYDDYWLDFLWSIMWENLFPVVLFYYILHTLKHRFLYTNWLKWLYAPFIITLIIDVFFALDYSFGVYILPIKESGITHEIITGIEDYSALLFNIIIALWCYKIVLNDKINPDYKIKWLKQLIVSILILVGLWLILDFVDYFFDTNIFIIVWILLSVFFWWVCYLGIHHLRLLEQKKEIHSELISRKKDEYSTILSKTENGYIQKLEEFMIKDELFKDVDLSREIIAQKLGLSDGYLSQLINSELRQNFTDYVNSFRVEAAKQMLKDDAFNKYSLNAIGMEAGFKSKSRFYTIFKKSTGITPGEFKKKS